MSADLSQTNILILVFAMPGCSACHEYLPKLQKQIVGYQKLGHPFVLWEIGGTLKPGQIPVVILDSTTQDAEVQALADKHQITGLPTTVLLPKVGYPAKFEGALSDGQIYELLNTAVATNR